MACSLRHFMFIDLAA